jgi:hypothetical protein
MESWLHVVQCGSVFALNGQGAKEYVALSEELTVEKLRKMMWI